jgi:hypothetical protein
MEGDLTQRCLWLKHFGTTPDPRIESNPRVLILVGRVHKMGAVGALRPSKQQYLAGGPTRITRLHPCRLALRVVIADAITLKFGNPAKLVEPKGSHPSG